MVQTIIFTFIYLLALFVAQNLKKFLQQIQSYKDAPFLAPKQSICPKQNFFWKIINIILIYLLTPFIVQNFKKNFPVDPVQSFEYVQFLDPKCPISPNENFFQMPYYFVFDCHNNTKNILCKFSWNITKLFSRNREKYWKCTIPQKKTQNQHQAKGNTPIKIFNLRFNSLAALMSPKIT